MPYVRKLEGVVNCDRRMTAKEKAQRREEKREIRNEVCGECGLPLKTRIKSKSYQWEYHEQHDRCQQMALERLGQKVA